MYQNTKKLGNHSAHATDFDLAWPLCPSCGEQILIIVDKGEQACNECGLKIIIQ